MEQEDSSEHAHFRRECTRNRTSQMSCLATKKKESCVFFSQANRMQWHAPRYTFTARYNHSHSPWQSGWLLQCYELWLPRHGCIIYMGTTQTQTNNNNGIIGLRTWLRQYCGCYWSGQTEQTNHKFTSFKSRLHRGQCNAITVVVDGWTTWNQSSLNKLIETRLGLCLHYGLTDWELAG